MRLPRFALCALLAQPISTSAGLILSVLSTNSPSSHSTGVPVGLAGSALFSGDSRYLFFATSDASAPSGASLHMFRRELASGAVATVVTTVDGETLPLAVSGDGQTAIYVSNASGLAVGASPSIRSLYQWNAATGASTRLAPSGSLPLAEVEYVPNAALTPDAQWLAFESVTDGTASGGEPGTVEIFLREMATGITRQITTQPATQRVNGARLIGLSEDARTLVYGLTIKTNRATADQWETDLVVVDVPSGAERRLTVASTLVKAAGSLETLNAGLSADGRYLAARLGPGTFDLAAPATHAKSGAIAWWDLTAGTNTVVVPGPSTLFGTETGPEMSPDGRSLVFQYSPPLSSLGWPELWVWQADTGLHSLADLVNPPGPQPDYLDPISPSEASFTADGRGLLFTAQTSKAVGAPANLFVQDLATGTRRVVGLDDAGNPLPVDVAFATASADGRYTVFNTGQPQSITADSPWKQTLFLVENATGSITGIAPPPMAAARTADGQSTVSSYGALSEDGRYTLFHTTAALVPEDTNDSPDIYRHDRLTGTNQLVSVRWDGLAAGAASALPMLSDDGQVAVFLSSGTGIVPGVTNRPNLSGIPLSGIPHGYVHDFAAGTTVMIDFQTNRTVAAYLDPDGPLLSANGRYVLYYTRASGIVTNSVTLGNTNLYLYDRVTQQNRLVNSNRPSSGPLRVNLGHATFAANSTTVAFSDTSLTFSGRLIYFYDIPREALTLLPVEDFPLNNGSLALSPDGRRVAYTDKAGGIQLVPTDHSASPRRIYSAPGTSLSGLTFTRDGRSVVFLRTTLGPTGKPADRQVVLVPLAGEAPDVVSQPDGRISGPDLADQFSVSANGRWVAFRSTATNLVPGLPAGPNVFLRDRDLGITYGVPLDTSAFPGGLQLSSDGHFLVFRAAAPLVGIDANGLFDVFAASLVDDVVPLDADGDGLPDNWERQFFYDLSANPQDDPDGDGSSNLAEFLVHTSPRQIDQPVVLTREKVGNLETITLRFNALYPGDVRFELSRDLNSTWQTTEVHPFSAGETVQRTFSVLPDLPLTLFRYTITR